MAPGCMAGYPAGISKNFCNRPLLKLLQVPGITSGDQMPIYFEDYPGQQTLEIVLASFKRPFLMN